MLTAHNTKTTALLIFFMLIIAAVTPSRGSASDYSPMTKLYYDMIVGEDLDLPKIEEFFNLDLQPQDYSRILQMNELRDPNRFAWDDSAAMHGRVIHTVDSLIKDELAAGYVGDNAGVALSLINHPDTLFPFLEADPANIKYLMLIPGAWDMGYFRDRDPGSDGFETVRNHVIELTEFTLTHFKPEGTVEDQVMRLIGLTYLIQVLNSFEGTSPTITSHLSQLTREKLITKKVKLRRARVWTARRFRNNVKLLDFDKNYEDHFFKMVSENSKLSQKLACPSIFTP